MATTQVLTKRSTRHNVSSNIQETEKSVFHMWTILMLCTKSTWSNKIGNMSWSCTCKGLVRFSDFASLSHNSSTQTHLLIEMNLKNNSSLEFVPGEKLNRNLYKSARHYRQILFAFLTWIFWTAINHSFILLSLLLNLCSTYKWNYKTFFNSICGKSAAGHMDYGRSNNVVSF